MATARIKLKTSLPARIERYPAKMVKGLARDLVARYVGKDGHLFDPFCGSGELLLEAARHGIKVTGVDINPYATLLAEVRLRGFRQDVANQLLRHVLQRGRFSRRSFDVDLDRKEYWFSAKTLLKLERIRAGARELDLYSSREGRSVLLAIAMAVRLCSRADDRSPKPFISKAARLQKHGRHIDPSNVTEALHRELAMRYGGTRYAAARVLTGDICGSGLRRRIGKSVSHVITSPPYLNAQDYFRNFKLELAVLDGLVAGAAPSAYRFVGTERGPLFDEVGLVDVERNRILLPILSAIERSSVKQATIIHRYLTDMYVAFRNVRTALKRDGILVVVCGDNLIGARRVETWRVLNHLLELLGFEQFDGFVDPIRARLLAPKRAGHRGLIKQESISAFRFAS